MPYRAHPLVVALLCAVAWIAAPANSSAQTSDDRATARALFDLGRQLMEAERYEEACAKLAESLRLVQGPGTRFHLAECYEKTGKLASAWVEYQEVAAASRAAGRSKHEAVATRRAEALAQRLPKLRIVVQDPVPGLSVHRDGKPVPQAQWDTALPVDLGRHRIEGKAPGHRTRRYAALVRREGHTVAVTIGPLGPLGPTGGEAEEEEVAAPTDGPDAAAVDQLRASGWVLASLGTAQLIAGVVLLAVGQDKIATSEDECPDRECPYGDEVYVDMGNDGRTLWGFGMWVAPSGLAAAIVGLTMVLVPEPTPDTAGAGAGSAGSWRMLPSVGPSRVGLAIQTSW